MVNAMSTWECNAETGRRLEPVRVVEYQRRLAIVV